MAKTRVVGVLMMKLASSGVARLASSGVARLASSGVARMLLMVTTAVYH